MRTRASGAAEQQARGDAWHGAMLRRAPVLANVCPDNSDDSDYDVDDDDSGEDDEEEDDDDEVSIWSTDHVLRSTAVCQGA